jgi:5-formyltetrahydrofolate cyclo-ligase
MTAELRSSLRKSLRASRRALSVREQRQASLRLSQALGRQLYFRRASRIAFYIPVDGEIDPQPLLQSALRQGKHCYLPVVHNSQMRFVRYRPGTRMRRNRFGIAEPVLRWQHRINARALDLVLVPLTGFDSHGTRLGMGKGFYDRAFGFRHAGGRASPRLVGIAHECQRREGLPYESWDVRMDEVVSDQAFYRRGRRTAH